MCNFVKKYAQMAAYQFNITVIPRNGLVEKYGFVPDKLFVDLKERQQFQRDKWDQKDIEEADYKDALTKNWWHLTDVSPIEIIHQMDKIVKRADYGTDTWINWKTYIFGENLEIDNDALMHINAETGKIERLCFRADLREPSLIFLHKMMELAQLYDWVFVDTARGFIANPNKLAIGKLIGNSNGFGFQQNLRAFLKDSKGSLNIKPPQYKRQL
jgi:hypothetical protein